MSALCAAGIWALAEAVYTPPDTTLILRKRFLRPASGSTSVLKIGTPLTLDPDSKYARLGLTLFNAWMLYFDWLNRERHGLQVNGTNYSVELVLLGDMSSKAAVEWATDYLIQSEGIDFFLGPYSSDLTGSMAPLVQAAGKVSVAPGASQTSVFQPHSNVFGMLTPNSQYLDSAMQAVGIAEGNSRKTLMYLAEELAWARSTCSEVPRLAGLNNMQLLSRQITVPASPADSDMVAVVATLMQRKPDVVVSCVYRQACHAMLREMERNHYTPKALIATICVAEDDFIASVGSVGKYAIGVAPWMANRMLQGDIASGWTSASFSEAYGERFGMVPPYQAASAFAAAATLVHAIEQAGSIDPMPVARVLQNLSTDSMYGRIAFDASGQCTNQMQVIQQHEGGLHVVFPSTTASAGLVYPKPDWASLQCFNTDQWADSRFGFLNGSCVECPLGRMSLVNRTLGGRVCTACSPGSFGVNIDFPECILCPTGAFSAVPASTRCENCPKGSFGQVSGAAACLKCPVGAVSEAVGMSHCTECGGGSYQDARGQTQCKRCERGRYGSGRASTACEDCPPTFSTDGTGYARASDCGCPAGQFNATLYDPSMSPTCVPCRTGITCLGFSNPLTLAPGFYEAASDFDPFRGVWACRPASKCPGGPPGTCADRLEGLGCSACPRGQVPAEGPRCRGCDSWDYFLVAFLPVALIVAVVWLFYASNSAHRIHTKVSAGAGIMLGQAITSIQILGMLARLVIQWPESLSLVRNFTKVCTFDGDAISFECMFGEEPLLKYFGMFLLPFFVSGVLGLMLAFSKLLPYLSCGRLQAWQKLQAFNALFHAQQTIFITITLVAASPWQCEGHPNGKSTVVSFKTVTCFDGDSVHGHMIAMSIILLASVVLPFIAISAWGTWSVFHGSQMHGAKAPQLLIYRYLIYRFRPSTWWWGNLFNLRQLVLGLTPMVSPDDTNYQLVYVLLILLVYLAIASRVHPWRTAEMNLYEQMAVSIQMAMAAIMMTFLDRSPHQKAQAAMLVSAVALALIAIGVTSLYSVWLACRRGLRGEYGRPFPREKEMDSFADQWQAVATRVSEVSIEENRRFIRSLSRYDRLDINRAIVTMGMMDKEPVRSGSRLWLHRSLRLVAPSENDQVFSELSMRPVSSRALWCGA